MMWSFSGPEEVSNYRTRLAMAVKPAWATNARQGPLRRHKQLVFFACEGLIALCDEREKSQEEGDVYEILMPDDFEYRAKGLAAFGRKAKASHKPWQRQEAKEMLKAAQDMLETVKEAKHMGDPSDPQVTAFWARHRRSNRVAFNFEHGKAEKSLDEMNRAAPDTGRTATHTMDGADLDRIRENATKIRRKPVKKARKGQIILDL